LNDINLAVDLPSEEASVSYPVSYCTLFGMSHKLPPTLYRQALNEAWVRADGCKQSLPGYP